MFDNFLSPSKLNLIKIFLICSLSICWAFFLYGDNLNASFWIGDDHEIVHYLGADHKIELREIWGKLINETEIGQFGRFLRFRPSYFVFRLLETWLWGDRVDLWYATRIAIFAFCLAVFWFVSSRFAGFWVGALATLYLSTFQYWSDIITNLGPSEIYGAMGLSLFCLGSLFFYWHNKTHAAWYLICLGLIIMTGSKENLIVFTALFLYLVWDGLKGQYLTIRMKIAALFSLAWIAWITASILIAVTKIGVDVYGYSTNIFDRTGKLLSTINRPDVYILLALIVAFMLIGFYKGKNSDRIQYASIKAALVTFFLFVVYLFQFLIYGRDYPNGDRYDFPGLMLIPIMIILLIWYFNFILDDVHKKYVPFAAFAIMGLLFFSQFNGINAAQSASRKNVRSTGHFTHQIKQLVTIVKENPGYALLIQASDPFLDYEPTKSYIRYLRFYGIDQPIAIVWAGNTPEDYSGIGATYARELSDLSAYASSDMVNIVSNVENLVPLAQMNSYGDKCILVLFSSKPDRNCQFIFDRTR